MKNSKRTKFTENTQKTHRKHLIINKCKKLKPCDSSEQQFS